MLVFFSFNSFSLLLSILFDVRDSITGMLLILEDITFPVDYIAYRKNSGYMSSISASSLLTFIFTLFRIVKYKNILIAGSNRIREKWFFLLIRGSLMQIRKGTA